MDELLGYPTEHMPHRIRIALTPDQLALYQTNARIAAERGFRTEPLDAKQIKELVPIAGRPPSLINLPHGCSFHPRCPYVREAHKKVEPKLEPVPGQAGHQVACLLDTNTRKKLWSELREGVKPETAREDVMEEEVA